MVNEARGVPIVNGRLVETSTRLSRGVDPFGAFSEAAASRFGQFLRAARPRMLWMVAMNIGTPMIAVTAPALLEKFGGDLTNNVPANLIAGSALGGAWGALVGAMVPVSHAGVRVPRAQAMGVGFASGIVLAPAVAGASRLVVNWFGDLVAPDAVRPESET